MKLNIPVGVSDIEELRKRDYYYYVTEITK